MKKEWNYPSISSIELGATSVGPCAIEYVHNNINSPPSGDVRWMKIGSVEGWFRYIYECHGS